MTQVLDTTRLELESKSDSVQPLAVFGEDVQIASLARRVRKLIKGAEAAPDQIIWRGCQLATMHKLDIFSGDIWIYPAYEGCRPDDWVVDIGISAWRRCAQRQAKYTANFQLLTADETAARVGEMYTPEDVGVECRLYRLDVARECKELGIPYTPAIGYGFWRKQARLVKKDNRWIPDQLANTETKEDKAKKRAEKKALRQAFSLDFPDDTAEGDWRVAGAVDAGLRREEIARSILAPADIQREENGDVLWA